MSAASKTTVAPTVKPVEDDASELPFLARVVNHLLTPGSSLTSSVWVAFNVIMAWLFLCWLLFVFSFPDNIHVWSFGVLGLGLLLSTNWFMREIFRAGLDYDSTKQREAKGISGKDVPSAKPENVTKPALAAKPTASGTTSAVGSSSKQRKKK